MVRIFPAFSRIRAEYGGCYHIETSPLICSANQWTGFYMITASVFSPNTGKCGLE